MAQRTVLKVDIWCQKCQKELLQAVSGLQGVDKIEIDAPKGTLTVTGVADPYEIIVRIRKAGKRADVVTIGPPPAPQKKPKTEKKPDSKAQFHSSDNCPSCQRFAVIHLAQWDEPGVMCSIL